MVVIHQLQAQRVEQLRLLVVVGVVRIIQTHLLQRVQVVVQVAARLEEVLPPQEVQLLPQDKVMLAVLATKKTLAEAVVLVQPDKRGLVVVETALLVALV
jgi:hypothetical protein